MNLCLILCFSCRDSGDLYLLDNGSGVCDPYCRKQCADDLGFLSRKEGLTINMARPTGPKHFIVRHDLKSLMALLGLHWNWEDVQDHLPRGYNRVEVRDRWISFAYTTSDRQERQLRQVTGFYECDEKASHQNIPRQGLLAADGHEQAWLIKGIPYREQPPGPVGVRPINEMLGRFTRDTIVDISEHEFERIRLETLTNWLDPERSLLGTRA